MDSKTPAPKKRSLFTQRALSKKTRAVDPEESLFNRAKELEAERVAEEERKRQKRIVKLEKKRSTQSIERKEDTETPPKRRKVSTPVEDKDGNDSESSSVPEEPEEPTWARRESTVSSPSSSSRVRPSSAKYREAQQSPSTTLSARYSQSLQQGEPSKGRQNIFINVLDSDSDSGIAVPFRKQGNQPISLDDDDDDEVVYVSGKPAPKLVEDDPLEEEEEEFPELIQAAKERERLRLQQATNASTSFSEQNHSQENYDVFGTPPAQDIDPSIEILITSRMEGTVPLRVKRKLSQRLQEARYAWCDRQDAGRFPVPDLKSAIFLTWKHKRLFDSASCVAFLKSDSEGVREGKVHLEAWTEEAFEISQKEEAAAKRREERGESEEEEPEVQEEVRKIRLVMKSKNMEPVKLHVRNNTLISKLIAAFESSRDVADGQEVSLWLDGEMLEPEDTVEDTDLEDLDSIEVRIK